MRKFWKNQKGVTMIEVLVTIAILAIVVAPCLSAFVMAQRGNVKAAETQQAYTAAANLMEELKGLSLDDAKQRLSDEYQDDNDKFVNHTDGLHVICIDNTTFLTIYIYADAEERENVVRNVNGEIPEGYILKGVVAP